MFDKDYESVTSRNVESNIGKFSPAFIMKQQHICCKKSMLLYLKMAVFFFILVSIPGKEQIESILIVFQKY